MTEQILDGNVVNPPVRRPEPGQRMQLSARLRARQRANDGLGRSDGDMALVARPAEEDDGGVVHGWGLVQGDCRGGCRLSVVGCQWAGGTDNRQPSTDYPTNTSAHTPDKTSAFLPPRVRTPRS